MTMHARVATFTTAILASIALSACGSKTSFSTPPGGGGGGVNCAANCNADPSCSGQACTTGGGAAGTCSATAPSVCTPPACVPNPVGAATETSCSDGIDNDCNGVKDCAEASCDGQQCGATSVMRCQAGLCTDVSSGLAIQVAPGRTRLPADGTATTTVTVTVTKSGTPQSALGITLSTTLGGLSSTTATTNASGVATVTFTAPATSGTATVTALVTAVPVVSQSATITMPALGAITLPAGGVQFPVMGVRSSGYREINGIAVAVTDDQGAAYPDGLAVRFEHQQLGGSHLSTPAAADTGTCVAATGCVGYLASLDAAGRARVNLYSGTVAGTLSVVASATAGGITLTFSIPSVAVIGAKANGANFAIDCAPRNIPALADTNCSTSRVDTQFTCEAALKDRFNNLLGTATQVTFVAEAAAVGQVATTPAYDPTKDPTQQTGLGIARQVFNTLGAGLPFDVPPAAGEPSVVHGLDGCGVRTHNPRDGVLTLIAIADGEEAFFDSNGNGVYDLGEPYIDLGEPYVDQNDNGQYDAGEWFLDVNQNGVYDGPNGVWDANAKLWTETVVVYTGVPTGPIDDGTGTAFLGSRWVAAASFGGACVASPAASFAVSAQQAGPPIVPPTSQGFAVVASDMNLNRLAATTTYSVVPEAGVHVTTRYDGLPAYADDYGFFFQYWPCDQGGNCASQCRATGANAPCLMQPAIASLSCGIPAGVTITGGTTPDTGTVGVDWKVQTTYPVLGGSTTRLFVEPILGTDN